MWQITQHMAVRGVCLEVTPQFRQNQIKGEGFLHLSFPFEEVIIVTRRGERVLRAGFGDKWVL